MTVEYPVAVDNDYTIWNAFANHYWPALYFVDAEGIIRHHLFGEGDYETSESVIQQLLGESGAGNVPQDLVSVDGEGAEAAADWDNLGSGENYVGYERSENFASPGGAQIDERRIYSTPGRMRLNQWALSGDWTVAGQSTVLNEGTATSPTASTPVISIWSWVRHHPTPIPGSECSSMGDRPARHMASTSTRRATARSTSSGSTS
jgi:hypothetical protein